MSNRRAQCLVDDPGQSDPEPMTPLQIFVVIGLRRDTRGRFTTEITYAFNRETAQAFYDDDCKRIGTVALFQVEPEPPGILVTLTSNGPIPADWKKATLASIETLMRH
jgi:hypothetical protein